MEKVRMEEIKRLEGKLETLEEIQEMITKRYQELQEGICLYESKWIQAKREGDIESAKDYDMQAIYMGVSKRELSVLMAWLEQEIVNVKGEM